MRAETFSPQVVVEVDQEDNVAQTRIALPLLPSVASGATVRSDTNVARGATVR